MTRAEAIRILRNIAFQFGSVMREDNITAVNMAIESLSAPSGDHISRADAVKAICDKCLEAHCETECIVPCTFMEALEAVPSAEAVPQSEQYKKGFEDAKRAFLIEYARESENMRKRNAQLEVTLNAQKAISARPQGEWIDIDNYYRLATCSRCHKVTMFEKWGEYTKSYDYCPNCGADMRGDTE